MVYKFGKKVSLLCPFFLKEPESPIHQNKKQKETFSGRSSNIISNMY